MGDGAIVEFASVVDAVACAVAVQKAVADRQAKSRPTGGSCSGSASTSATWWSRATTCWATGSTSPPGWSSCASPAACWSRAPPTTSCRAGSGCRWSSPASSGQEHRPAGPGVAIMAADIVGYSRLVEKDEAGTLAAIKGCARRDRPTASQAQGPHRQADGRRRHRRVRLGGGCSILCRGAPEGNGGSAGRVPPERRIVFRIGVNLGDVVVEGDDLLGDGVNVAARLEQLCDPGGVLFPARPTNSCRASWASPRFCRRAAGQEHRRAGAHLSGAARAADSLAAAVPAASAERFCGRRAVVVLLRACWRRSGGCGQSSQRAPAPPIAVLPFDNLGGDEQTGRSPTASPRTSSPTSRASATRGDRPQFHHDLQRKAGRHRAGRLGTWTSACPGGKPSSARGEQCPCHGAAHRTGVRHTCLVGPLGSARRRSFRCAD